MAVAAPIRSVTLDFQVISFNIRVDTHHRFASEKPWGDRKAGVVDILNREAGSLPTLIGLQEARHHQLVDVLSGLNSGSTKDWEYYGHGRDNGKKRGEFSPILYRTSEWKLVNGTTRWLSTTPDRPSTSWHEANIRIVTITTFQHIQTGQFINYFNTHFDHKSEEARQHSAELITSYIEQEPNNYPSFLSGDFNSQSTDLSYTTLDKNLFDTRQTSAVKYSQIDTYTGFEPSSKGTVIDFIWYPKNDTQTKPVSYNVIDTVTPQGFRASDHRPVIVHFKVDF